MRDGAVMLLTRSFKELVQLHVASDPVFAEALLREGIDAMLAGNIDTGKRVLRDYIRYCRISPFWKMLFLAETAC
jgi:hypothetical protein